jgi:hypothetical protein
LHQLMTLCDEAPNVSNGAKCRRFALECKN